jgi:hypothetical protein
LAVRLESHSLIEFLNLELPKCTSHHAVQTSLAEFTIEIISRGTMRLIDARKFVNEERDFFLDYRDEFTTPYTIVSHRWEDDEISLQDVRMLHISPSLREQKGYQKVRNACLRTLAGCFRYVWIDTCMYWNETEWITTADSSKAASTVQALRSFKRQSTPCSTGMKRRLSVMSTYATFLEIVRS